MNIGFDAKRYFLNATGLGTYSRNTIRLLDRYAPEHDYFLYTPKISSRFGSPVSGPNIHTRTPANVITRVFHPLWRTFLLGRQTTQDSLDIFHGLSHEIPYGISRATKTVVTVHDLIFLRHPKLYHRVDVALYTAKYRSSCRRADRIIAISEQTKQDITTFFSIDPEKIDVVYQSCDPAFYLPLSAHDLQSVRSRYSLPDAYLLYVGSFAERKNVLTLIEALGRMHPTLRIPLVLVGRGNKSYLTRMHAAIEKNRLTKDIIFLHTVPAADLPAIYQQARLFVYPSLYEGFGIPILEALFSRTPVITSQGSCFREAGGPDTIYTPPGDVDALARSMEQVLKNSALAANMREKGRHYARAFHERQVAHQLLAVYIDLCAQQC
ncbi:MAG: glycosyltransferase family 1 protein [Desulfoplanes sp.]